MTNSKKGQYFSFDAIIASVIFILAITSLLSYWNGARNSFNLQNSEITKEAFRISNLIFTPGAPVAVPPFSFTCAQQTQLGFAVSWTDKRLDGTRLDGCALTTDEIKQRFRTRFGVSIYVDGRRKVGSELTARDITNSPNIVVVHRVASLVSGTRESIVNVDVYLYE